jgi:polar amino acid transport system permease protein
VVSLAADHRGDLPGAMTVTLALAWFSAAAVMHSVLSGLSALPAGQYEAALTQGFSTGQTLWRILLPQVLRNILPSLLGIFISLLKDTSLAFIVNVPELTTVAGSEQPGANLPGRHFYLYGCGLLPALLLP